MTQKMKTLCVGRFLIDLPEESRVEMRQARIDGFEITTFNETEEEFQKRVVDRQHNSAQGRIGVVVTRI